MAQRFDIGQVIEAIILRVANKTQFLVSIDGTYYWIENLSDANLRPGGSVKLVVDSLSPLRMKLYKQEIAGHIHFHI